MSCLSWLFPDKMKKLILVGAGGFGREVYSWALQCRECGKDWKIAGFLDDNPECLGSYEVNVPWLGRVSDWQPSERELFVCTVGQTAPKRKCVDILLEKGAEFVNLIHPTCVLGDRIELGKGIILCPGVTLTCDLSLGDHTALNIGSSVGHDASIGKYCQFQSRVAVNGYVQIGSEVLMGTSSMVLPERKIGNMVTVGMGSVVFHNVPDGVTVQGNPARIIYDSHALD